MKSTVFKAAVALFSLALGTLATQARAESAFIGVDGCYQTELKLTQDYSVPLILCLSGSAEESIGGAEARVAFIGADRTTLLSCAKTIHMALSFEKDVNHTVLDFDAKTENLKLAFDGKTVNGQEKGTLTYTQGGKTDSLSYFKLSDSEASQLFKLYDACQ